MGKTNKTKKTTSKSKTSKKAVKGSVGFLYGGMLKSGTARYFWTDDKDPEDTAAEYRTHYGPNVSCRYVNCENAENVYEKALKELGDEANGSCVNGFVNTLIKELKEVAGVKTSHVALAQDKKTDKKKDTKKKDTKKKTTKKAKKDESDDESGDNSGDESGSDDEVSDVEDSDSGSEAGSDDESGSESEEEEKKSKSKKGKKGAQKKGGKRK
jgi:hypothetical protein